MVHKSYLDYQACTKNSLPGKAATNCMTDAVEKGINQESPNDLDTAKAVYEAYLEVQAECLRKFPLAALDRNFDGPPAGEVFEHVPFWDWPF